MPAAKQPPQEPPQEPPTVPEPGEPQWARELKQLLTDLPGKLRATITDDDRASIADRVHGLFEQSGAFHQVQEDEPEPGDEPEPVAPNGSMDEQPGKDSWARKMFGRY